MKFPYSAVLGAALLGATAIAGTALADPYADAVESDANVTDAANATGMEDAVFAVLGDGGSMILRFTDNTCLAGAGADVRVFDAADAENEDYAVATGLEGESLVSAGTHTESGQTDIDVGSAFTRISLTDADPDLIDGAEIDAVQCLNNLAFGTDHIAKENTGDTEILITSKHGFNALQTFSFRITIENPDGADLTGFVFQDTVPGEFDVTSAVADNTDSPTNAGCTDVVAVENKKPNQKLAPDKISWSVDLAAGESCAIDVEVSTDADHPGPLNTPTECPEGGVVLNEGVNVSDADGNLILVDDDTLALSCTPPDDPD